MVPRCVLRNLTRFGINMGSRLLPGGRGREDGRARPGQVGLRRGARVELLALVDPPLDPDRALGRDREIDDPAQRVQRDAAEMDVLAPRNLRAAEAALDLDLHALGAEVHDHLGVAAHRAAVRRAAVQLLRDRLAHDLAVELGGVDLVDLDLDGPPREEAQVLDDLVDLGALLADEQAHPGGGEDDAHLLADALDLDPRDAGEAVLLLHEVADPTVLHEPRPEVLLRGVPAGAPPGGDSRAEGDRVDLLAHLLYSFLPDSGPDLDSGFSGAGTGAAALGAWAFFALLRSCFCRLDRSFLPSFSGRSSRTNVTWHIRFLIIVGRRTDDGRHRLMIGPPSTRASTRCRAFASRSIFLSWASESAFAAADSRSFLQKGAARFEQTRRIARALL